MMVVFSKVQLDVRDLGGYLDFTFRDRAGTPSKRVGEATVGVASVGALPLVFRSNRSWFVASICLLASMLLRHLMSPSSSKCFLGLLLCVLCGPLRCRLLIHLLF